MRVSSISAKKKKPNCLVVKFEDEESIELHVEVVARHGILSGTEVDEEKMGVLLAEDEVLRCREAAWRLLSIRPRTKMELVRALRQRRYMKSTCEAIADDLKEKGFLNDESFARMFVEERTRRRHGPRLIEQELRARGVNREAAAEAVDRVADAEQQAEDARELLRKWNRRSKPEDPRKRKAAAAQFLIRRGYEQEIVWDCVRQVLGGEEYE